MFSKPLASYKPETFGHNSRHSVLVLFVLQASQYVFKLMQEHKRMIQFPGKLHVKFSSQGCQHQNAVLRKFDRMDQCTFQQ